MMNNNNNNTHNENYLQDREALQHRLQNREKSNAAKLGWKRNHGHYTIGIKKRERDRMNKSFYDVCKDMEEHLITEAEITKDNVFETKADISLESIAGGISLSVNKENGNVSISTSLEQTGSGMYRPTNADANGMQEIYNNIKEDLFNLCKNFDSEINQIMAKYGLKSTK